MSCGVALHFSSCGNSAVLLQYLGTTFGLSLIHIYITDYEVKLGGKIAEVLCGGNVTPGTPVSEQYILDLEREGFKSLCGEKKTQERIQFTLKTGKTLRN